MERWLEPRRLVTSEIHAIAPSYRRVGVSATLHLACEAEPAAVLRSAIARIRTFFDPLEGGSEGTGWPFGRTVYRAEVMALLVNVDGVRSVTGLGLLSGADTAGGCGCGCGCGSSACDSCSGGCGCKDVPGGGAGDAGGRCDNVILCPHELVIVGALRLSIVSDIGGHLRRSDAHECEQV